MMQLDRNLLYVADMHSNGEANRQSTQQKQIAAAQPLTGQTNAFRSDQLIGTDVRNAKNENSRQRA